MSFLFGCTVGLLVGWNLLPQPQWVINLWAKIKAKIA